MEHPSEIIMKKAINFALKKSTVGVIITNGEKIVVMTGGTIFSKNHDVTGHSEIVAIRKACKIFNSNNLSGCWLYTTYEPCPMCMSAICWAKIDGVVYGASHLDRNDRWKWSILIPSKEIIKKSDHKPILIENYLRKEAKIILEE